MKNFPCTLSPLSLAVFGLFASLSAAASAQNSTPLDTIVVSGSRAETKLSETPVSIGSVTRAEWDADKPKTMGEIINRIPGVFWNDLGNEQHSMGIRQPISTQSVYQYLEDGIPIRPLGVFNHNALNAININGASGVEVVKGAASSLYGSNAVGGAVNFLTQRSSRTPTGYMGIRHDNTDGFTRVDSGASNTWGDLGLRFSHYSSQRDSLNWQQHSGGTKDSFSLRGDYNLSATSWMRASLVHTNLDSDTPGSLFENDFRTHPGKSINTFTWRKDKTTRANVAWEGETTRGGLTTVTFFARNNDHAQLPNYTINLQIAQQRQTALAMRRHQGGTSCRGTINNNHVQSLGVDIKHTQQLDKLRARLVTGIYIDRSQNDFCLRQPGHRARCTDRALHQLQPQQRQQPHRRAQLRCGHCQRCRICATGVQPQRENQGGGRRAIRQHSLRFQKQADAQPRIWRIERSEKLRQVQPEAGRHLRPRPHQQSVQQPEPGLHTARGQPTLWHPQRSRFETCHL
jgi:iron complex outermembrane recepter protein